MLKRIEFTDINGMKSLSCALGNSPWAQAVGFLFSDTARLSGAWVQETEARKTALALLQKDGSLYLQADENADFEELNAFFPFAGCVSVRTTEETVQKLGAAYRPYAELYRLQKTPIASGKSVPVTDGLSSVYDLLTAGRGDETDRMEWISRTSRGIFGGFTAVRAIYADNSPVSVAVLDYTDDAAFVRDVYTHKAFRKRGLSFACLSDLLSENAKERSTTLLCKNSAAKRLYESLGFVSACTAVQIDRTINR